MIHTQLEMGLTPAAIAAGVASFSLHAVSRAPAKWLDSPDDASRPWPTSGGRRLSAIAARSGAPGPARSPRIWRAARPDTALWAQVIRYLKEGYSPEQIAGTLALVHSETPSLNESHETIYTAIYAMPRGALRTAVIGWLPSAMLNGVPAREAKTGGDAFP